MGQATRHTNPRKWPQLGPGEPPTEEQVDRWLEAFRPLAVDTVPRPTPVPDLIPEAMLQLRKWLAVGKADLERSVAP